MRAVAALAGFTQESFNSLKATMAQTDAEQQAAQRMDTFKGSVEILGGVIDTLKMSIGDKFLPVLKSLIDRFTEFLQSAGPGIIEWSGGMAEQFQALVDRWLPKVLEAFSVFFSGFQTEGLTLTGKIKVALGNLFGLFSPTAAGTIGFVVVPLDLGANVGQRLFGHLS